MTELPPLAAMAMIRAFLKPVRLEYALAYVSPHAKDSQDRGSKKGCFVFDTGCMKLLGSYGPHCV